VLMTRYLRLDSDRRRDVGLALIEARRPS
jgi:hypothetical protein